MDINDLSSASAPHAFISSGPLIETPTRPANFGAAVTYGKEQCQKLQIGSPSTIQTVTIASPVGTSIGGSFKLQWQNERSECIAANVSVTEMISVLRSLLDT